MQDLIKIFSRVLFFLCLLQIGDDVIHGKIVLHDDFYFSFAMDNKYFGFLILILGSVILLSVPMTKKIGFPLIFCFIFLIYFQNCDSMTFKLDSISSYLAIIAITFILMHENNEIKRNKEFEKVLKNEETKKNLLYHNKDKYRVCL